MPNNKDRRGSRQPDFNDDDDDVKSTRGGSMLHLAEDLISKFSGKDDFYTVSAWIQDIEDNAEIFNWSPTQRLLVARRSLTGTAALWLRSEKTHKTWDDLRTAITKEFSDTMDAKAVHEMMSSRRKKPNESCFDYMLTMKALGKRGKLPDYVAIKYIVEGIEDSEMSKMMLYGVTSYADLKEKLKIYEMIAAKSRKPMQVKTVSSAKASVLPRVPVARCFSCGEMGHVSAECPRKAQGRKCFNCNEFGHTSPECNKPRIAKKTDSSAMASTSRTGPMTHTGSGSGGKRHVGSGVGSELQSKQVYFHSTQEGDTLYAGNAVLPTGKMDGANDVRDAKTEGHFDRCDSDDVNKLFEKQFRPVKNVLIWDKSVIALIDSGSDVNLMSEKCVTSCSSLNINKNKTVTMSGVGFGKVRSLGVCTTQIAIDDNIYDDIVFHIVPVDCMPYCLILGNEFLCKVVTVMKGGSVWMKPVGEEWLHQVNCVVCPSDCVGQTSDPAVKEEVQHLVESYQPCPVKEAPIELKIILKDEVPVAQRPRRISPKEQEEVDRQIKEWLRDGIVRLKMRSRRWNACERF
ncbi:hypothetical protein ABMA28_006717 [Loxostege sticticalis]|uniref:CCHC-type domain-containing protein n=1 Tax=Loxostege sticticalis TaxID=481309 RepID=A0ABD0TN48_LOXSC